MIVRSRRSKETLLGRILRLPFQGGKVTGGPQIASADEFRFEIIKETARSNRRKSDPDFALIVVEFVELKSMESGAGRRAADQLAQELFTRLRVSDVIGWLGGKFSVLLPETGADGAARVAKDIEEIGFARKLNLTTDVTVYPWDDQLAAESGVLAELQVANRNDDDDDDTPGFGEAESFEDESEFVGVGNDADSGHVVKMSALRQRSDLPLEQMAAFASPVATPVWKRAIDIVGSGTGLLLLTPVFLIAAAAIRMSSRGPVFFKQAREGKDGRAFNIWKFRTMRVDAEELQKKLRDDSEQDGPAFKMTNDPRVTTVGKYLRKSCIDELPQLINVLRGEMSIVGPRPLPMQESKLCTPWQRQRLRVLPGLTCIWQVDGGRNVKFKDWMRMDMEYLRKRSFLYDCKLIVRTAFVALLHRGSV